MSSERRQATPKFKSDPIFLEILNNRLNGIVSEMGHIIHKASFSPFIKEAWDFGEGLVSLAGEIFSYPRDIGVSFMVAALMEDAVKAFDDYQPGDIIVANDPMTTGGLCTHLPDFHLLKPYFRDGELICFSWTFIHSSDVGGLVPGSIAPIAYDIYQEGLRLPAMKLVKAGVLNDELMSIILANTRTPHYNEGDLKALIAAMHVAERRLDQTIDKYGVEPFRQGIEDLLLYGELRARDVIADIPDGAYEMADYMELDMIGQAPARIKLRLEVTGSEIHLDFSGSDPQVRAALNLPTFGKNHHFINAGVFNFIYAIDNAIPLNRGILRPIRVTIPPGTILNPEPGAAVGVRFATGVRVMDIVFGCLSQATESPATPERVRGKVPTAGSGLLGVVLLSLVDERTGELKVNVVQPMWGGSGGRPTKDGIDGADLAAGFLRNIPAETSEAEMPMLLHKYQFADGAPPAGKWRGGLGLDLRFEVFTPDAVVTARGMERFQFHPWGRKGGEHGTLGQTVLNPDTPEAESIGKIVDALRLEPGMVVQILTPSGGAFGDPFERNPDLVLRDVKDEFLSVEEAERQYGVSIDRGKVDMAATAKLRADPKRRSPAEFDFGPAREAFEKMFSPAMQDRLVGLLDEVPPSQRQYWKGRVVKELQRRPREDRAGVLDVAAILGSVRARPGSSSA
ncbi:MAG: hydantoinase B/oxoprolinase family protein [Hyphomicrobiales bacterium]